MVLMALGLVSNLHDPITPSHNCTATGILVQETTGSIVSSMYSMTISTDWRMGWLHAHVTPPSMLNISSHLHQTMCWCYSIDHSCCIQGPHSIYTAAVQWLRCVASRASHVLCPHSQARYFSRQQDVPSQQLYVGETSEYTNAMQSQVKHLQFAASQAAVLTDNCNGNQ